MRHTFTAWALALRIDPNKLVHLIGHGSKKMIYEVYGNYMEGLETDAGQILGYFGKYFIGCMSSKGFGQIRYRNKRGFQVPDTSFCSIKQPLKSNCTSCVESSFSS
jgi:hypothetical protein